MWELRVGGGEGHVKKNWLKRGAGQGKGGSN